MILTLGISGYRSIRDLVMPLGRLNVITGPNGSGKSSLYRAIRLLADVAQGRIIGSLAVEGGLHSTLWAGPERFSAGMKRGDTPIQGTVRRNPVSLKLGFSDEDYGYAIDLGLPAQDVGSSFNRDPEIKAEAVWAGEFLRRNTIFATRTGPIINIRNERGSWQAVLNDLPPFDSMMTHAADPTGAPELLALRERMREWRFYDHFRTDPASPARRAQIGTRTPILAPDGADLAAALQTIVEIGDANALERTIEDAFPGSTIEILDKEGLFGIIMHQRGLLRPLHVAELSDGTLRYLLLAAALLTPRPPALLVLNEPETSLHPDLLPALAQLIAQATERSQVIVVSHAAPLVAALADANGSTVYVLQKELGETVITDCESPPWAWPKR